MQFPQGVALQNAKQRIGQGVNTMRRRVSHLLLHPDEITAQEEAQDLSAAVAQCLEPEGPGMEQGEQRRIGLIFLNQGLSSPQPDLPTLQGLHQLHFLLGVFDEKRQRP